VTLSVIRIFRPEQRGLWQKSFEAERFNSGMPPPMAASAAIVFKRSLRAIQ